ncbi:MAG: hypothetical protein SPK50_06920, partial [Mobiluncus porci]|uniref:hypothetical protein n=1 Tax=Mobiluncus porci TaxID=2652278 RepID=UPI0023F39DDD
AAARRGGTRSSGARRQHEPPRKTAEPNKKRESVSGEAPFEKGPYCGGERSDADTMWARWHRAERE